MKKKLINLTVLGDSIIRYKKNKTIYDWSKQVKKNLKKKQYIKLKLKVKSIVGINSIELLKFIPKNLKKNKFNEIIIFQIGINDSWHYKSMSGKPCVKLSQFKKNLNDIKLNCLELGFKKIIFLNYHKLENNRMEINKRTLNQNLNNYNKEIKIFCKKNNLYLIDIHKFTKKYKNICLPMPDGIHLNYKGTKIYSNIISNFIIKKI